MPPAPRLRTTLIRHAAALLCALSIAGCQSAMSNEGSYTTTTAEWPLKFRGHNFGAFSYSTYGCKLLYRGRLQLNEPDDVLQIASDTVPNYPDNLNGSWGPINNFPPPAQVSWRSKDGSSHHAEVDIGEIFKDRLIRHNLRREEMVENQGSLPEIIIEVNDRTINVYTRTHLGTKELQKPGNRFSDFRNDLIKVYSRTY